MSKIITSSISKMIPNFVYDTITGEEISVIEHNIAVKSLIEYVQRETQELFDTHREKIIDDIATCDRLGSANSFARQRGYVSNYKDLPREIKAKSRINELILHKFVSETASYVNNLNQRKQYPSFAPKINLGAVDKQMVSMSQDKNILSLLFKCWDKEYLVEFTIPDYVMKRNIHKWCLPLISIKDNEVYYYFSFMEKASVRVNDVTEYAGVDLGRRKAFVLSVVNKKGKRIADYSANGHTNFINLRRERLLQEKKHILNKIDQYTSLGMDTTVLEQEAKYKANKALRLGGQLSWQVASDINKKLVKHNTNILAVENLKWAVGAKYGSKWVFSQQQSAIEHSLSRSGIRTKRVNPKNTSQCCYKCNTPLIHKSKKRTVFCVECKSELDRDLNASLKIAKKVTPYPNQYSRIGDNCSSLNVSEQVIDHKDHNTILKKSLQKLQL